MNTNDDFEYLKYMEGIVESDRQILSSLFEQAKLILVGFQLNMKYKFPLLDGNGKFGLAYRNKYVVLYFHHDKLQIAVEEMKEKLGKYTLSGEGLRYKRVSDINIDAIIELLHKLFIG